MNKRFYFDFDSQTVRVLGIVDCHIDSIDDVIEALQDAKTMISVCNTSLKNIKDKD